MIRGNPRDVSASGGAIEQPAKDVSDMDDVSTLELQGFTPYAQVPQWILRSGSRLSHGAVRLYGVIMTYADNSSKTAFPSREKLAQDMGIKPRSISTYTKELEDYGALQVTRRRNLRTGNFYANHYVLVFTEPGAKYCTPPDATERTITTPTISTTPTAPTPSPSGRSESSLRSPSTSGGRSDRELLQLARDMATATSDSEQTAAYQVFMEAFQAQHGDDPGFWDYGWSERLQQLVKKHGLDYGTAKWLSIFTNAAA